MKKEVSKKLVKEKQVQNKLPRSIKTILIIAFIFYIWFFVSALLIPLSKFLAIPESFIITLYNMLNFPASLLGFVLCVSLISSIIIISHFNKKKYFTKFLLIESTTLILYYIIPIIATLLILAFIALGVIIYLPSVSQIGFFLEDLFLFTTFLFVLTAVLNIAIQKLIKIRDN
jgi:hypothetical protein